MMILKPQAGKKSNMVSDGKRKSRTRIMVIKEPLTCIQNDQEDDADEIIPEQTIRDYIELQEKCEAVILRIKKRKQEQSNL